MTRPFISLDECQEQGEIRLAPANSGNLNLVPLPMMYSRAKFSRLEILPPVLCTRRVYIQVAFLALIGLIIFLVRMMSTMRGTFMHMHLESDTDGELVILPEEFAQDRHAFCLDGSPPAYYFKQSSAPTLHSWIIHLQSGGWCSSLDSCMERSETSLGSSLRAEMLLNFDGIMSSDCSKNPDFCLWHMIDLHYCDGGSFLGSRSDSVNSNSRQLYLRGAAVFDALIDYLLINTLFKNAKHVILAGSSAGSLGALIHSDNLRRRLPETVESFHVVVDGGLFVDVPDINGDLTMGTILKETFHFHHINNTPSLQLCTISMIDEEKWRCMLPEVSHPSISSPLFFINSLYDSWFRPNALKIQCSAEVCSHVNLREVVYTKQKLLQHVSEIIKSEKNGVFLTSCPAHTLLMKSKFFTPLAHKQSAQQGLWKWYHGAKMGRNVTEVRELSDALKLCTAILSS